jgi:DNA processing protein
MMGWEPRSASGTPVQPPLFAELSENEQQIVALLKLYKDPGIDVLVTESGMNSSRIAKLLLNLELSGIIRCLPGKRYQLA